LLCGEKAGKSWTEATPQDTVMSLHGRIMFQYAASSGGVKKIFDLYLVVQSPDID
jgi:hypothetical protein